MANEKYSCPSCGLSYQSSQPLPQAVTCGNCETVFSPVAELQRYSMYICRPGERSRFLEVQQSGLPFIVPRQGDTISTKFLKLKPEQALVVTGLEFGFVKRGSSSRQEVYVFTEVVSG